MPAGGVYVFEATLPAAQMRGVDLSVTKVIFLYLVPLPYHVPMRTWTRNCWKLLYYNDFTRIWCLRANRTWIDTSKTCQPLLCTHGCSICHCVMLLNCVTVIVVFIHRFAIMFGCRCADFVVYIHQNINRMCSRQNAMRSHLETEDVNIFKFEMRKHTISYTMCFCTWYTSSEGSLVRWLVGFTALLSWHGFLPSVQRSCLDTYTSIVWFLRACKQYAKPL